MINSPLVTIIILNYNGFSVTLECIESLSKLSYKNTEIIIVDNGSTDGSAQKLEKEFPSIKIIRNKTNKGYAEGNNIGFRKSHGELVLFLNNDTIVDKQFLQPLINELLDESVGAVQPKILNYPETEIIDSIGSYFINTGFLYHFGHNKKDAGKYNKYAEIYSMKGACMLFRRDVLEKTGVFDHDYFAYFEETDLCHRVYLAGFKIIYVHGSVIYHKGGATSKRMKEAFINYHSYKNRIYTYLKNFELRTLARIMPLHLLFCECASLMYLLTLRFEMSIAIQRAIFWNIRQIPKTITERKRIISLRKRKDQEYLPALTRSVRLSYYYHLFISALKGYED